VPTRFPEAAVAGQAQAARADLGCL
jgi:hypothetical protein